jgi:hypothetical protein
VPDGTSSRERRWRRHLTALLRGLLTQDPSEENMANIMQGLGEILRQVNLFAELHKRIHSIK